MGRLDHILARIRAFGTGESGAVTTDLIVLTAASVTLSLAALNLIQGGTNDLAQTTSDSIAAIEPDADGNDRDRIGDPPPRRTTGGPSGG